MKSVSDSCQIPLDYYQVNLTGLLNVLECIKEYANQLETIVFSSSASVYGESSVPLTEESPCHPKSVYGRSKWYSEFILRDFMNSECTKNMQCIVLRYFNPVGAHPSHLLGENPYSQPTNLMPLMIQVLKGKLEYLNIYGTNWNTRDGSGCRDFIHIMDLANAHVCALYKPKTQESYHIYNIGSQNGYTVLEMVKMMEKVSNQSIPLNMCKAREGDIGMSVADCQKSKKELGWKCQFSLEEMCFDLWNYHLHYVLQSEIIYSDNSNI